MRLVTYLEQSTCRSGIERDGWVVDTAGLPSAAAHGVEGNRAVLGLEPEAMESLGAEADAACAAGEVVGRADELTLGPPIPDPPKIVCVGLNYDEHLEETKRDRDEHPTLFAKFSNSLAGPRSDVRLPAASGKVDYEGELAIVIGRPGYAIEPAAALDHVAGGMVVNDVTARDLQLRTSQWLPGKAIDGFLPSGPALVTIDEIEDLQNLDLETRVNGETVQSANTASMIFSIPELIASISEALTLERGDVICTGTPGGVGSRREPPLWLGNDSLVEVEISEIGRISNRFRA